MGLGDVGDLVAQHRFGLVFNPTPDTALYAQVATASEIRRVLRPGGAAHIADIVGHPHTFRHGAMQGTFAHSHNDIPELFTAAGFSARLASTRRNRFVGEVAYYVAKKA